MKKLAVLILAAGLFLFASPAFGATKQEMNTDFAHRLTNSIYGAAETLMEQPYMTLPDILYLATENITTELQEYDWYLEKLKASSKNGVLATGIIDFSKVNKEISKIGSTKFLPNLFFELVMKDGIPVIYYDSECNVQSNSWVIEASCNISHNAPKIIAEPSYENYNKFIINPTD